LKKIDITSLVKPNVCSLRAYEASEIPCKVKLDANESPYGFRVLKSIEVNRYPDPEAKSLRKLVAKELKVKTENILHGNGSDELIYYLITTFGGPVLYPTPTFSMYGIISQALGEERFEIPLDERFDLDIEEILRTIKKHKPKLIFLSSPNNPTGNCFSPEKILKILELTSSPFSPLSLVVIDEAYQSFSGKRSFLSLLKKYKNLIILKTLSKIGLAGLRVGFIIADSEIIKEVNKVRLPFNLNSISQRLAIEALKNKKQLQSCIASIISERKRLFKEMEKINGIKPYPSEANFILFRSVNSDKIYKALQKKGILIRNMKGIIDGCLRVTVGTPKENTFFLKELKRSLSKGGF
jgi:histidinol-phosphate aminotransferase